MWKLEERENSKKSREGTRKYTKVNRRQGQNDSEGKFKITGESPSQTLDRKGFHKLSNKNKKYKKLDLTFIYNFPKLCYKTAPKSLPEFSGDLSFSRLKNYTLYLNV